jgi:hypothetical protein
MYKLFRQQGGNSLSGSLSQATRRGKRTGGSVRYGTAPFLNKPGCVKIEIATMRPNHIYRGAFPDKLRGRPTPYTPHPTLHTPTACG